MVRDSPSDPETAEIPQADQFHVCPPALPHLVLTQARQGKPLTGFLTAGISALPLEDHATLQ